MHILLTNDDGILAPGLLALWEALTEEHRVRVVAPETEQSAVGHSITLADPIRVKEIKRNGDFFGQAISGTPADCVRLGVGEFIDRKPDLVVSGINLGANVGVNVLYSGTVSAATEAAMLDLPAIAVSLDTFTEPDFSPAARFITRLVKKIPDMNLARGVALNVNIPHRQENLIKGVAWAGQSMAVPGEVFHRRVDPRGKTYYWRGTEVPPRNLSPHSDYALLDRGYITITPIQYDMSHHSELHRLDALHLF